MKGKAIIPLVLGLGVGLLAVKMLVVLRRWVRSVDLRAK